MTNKKMYTKVLIADDKKFEIEPLKNLFEANGIEVVYVDNPYDVYKNIEKKDIDIIILDWYFAQPSNKYAKEIIDVLLDNQYFIPIFIYSNNIEDKEPVKELPEYPSILLNSMAKPKLENVEEVKIKIDKWFKENPNVRLANKWYKSVQLALGKTLIEMYNKTDNGVINLLNQTYKTEQTDGSEDIISLIMTILHDNILKESDILDELQIIIKESQFNQNENTLRNYQQLRAFEMYADINKGTHISTGDVFKLNNDILMKSEICNNCITSKETDLYAISISAECDYARSSEKLRYHKFILGTSLIEASKQFEKKSKEKLNSFISGLSNNNFEGLHYVPFVLLEANGTNEFENIVFDFQNVISVKKVTFDTAFRENRVCRLRPIYIQHLLRRYSSFSSRIGIPEIPGRNSSDLTDKILEEITVKTIEQIPQVVKLNCDLLKK